MFSVSENVVGTPLAVECPSPFGPRYVGQLLSAAKSGAASRSSESRTRMGEGSGGWDRQCTRPERGSLPPDQVGRTEQGAQGAQGAHLFTPPKRENVEFAAPGMCDNGHFCV